MKSTGFLIPLVFTAFLFWSCSSEEDPAPDNPGSGQPEIPSPEVQALDLVSLDNGSGVMMQAFYWDVEPRHEWWALLTDKINGWADAGIDRIWLPPASKAQSGGYSMGYDVSDYFDLGDLFQHGTTETRFGSRAELDALIDAAHTNGMEVIADIVINHNSGGGLEYNPYRDKETWTLFDATHGNASGKFNRNYENFYPNSTSPYDPGSLFYGETNLDHNQPYVQNWLWAADYSVANYYKNEVGFDGWRFDYVLGYEPWVVKAWLQEMGGFSVAELWNGDANVLEDYIQASGSRVFDFATFYKLEEAMDRYDDLTFLTKKMVWQTYPDKAVTFTANHDTEKDDHEDNSIMFENKLKAYAFILTHPGYPTIFYSDYEEPVFQEELKQLILIHNSLATGEVEVLFADQDEYVMKRSGTSTNPGLILYLTTSGNTKRRTVASQWKGSYVMDYSLQTGYTSKSDDTGMVELEAPANGYAVYSIME